MAARQARVTENNQQRRQRAWRRRANVGAWRARRRRRRTNRGIARRGGAWQGGAAISKCASMASALNNEMRIARGRKRK